MFRIFRTFRKSYLFGAHAATSPSKSTLNISIGLGIDRLSKSSPDMIWCTSQSVRQCTDVTNHLSQSGDDFCHDSDRLWFFVENDIRSQADDNQKSGGNSNTRNLPASFPNSGHLCDLLLYAVFIYFPKYILFSVLSQNDRNTPPNDLWSGWTPPKCDLGDRPKSQTIDLDL